MLYLGVGLALVLVGIAWIIVLLQRLSARPELGPLQGQLDSLGTAQTRVEAVLRDELARGRAEGSENSRQAREELAASIGASSDAVVRRFDGLATRNEDRLSAVRATLDEKLTAISADLAAKHDQMRDEANANRSAHRIEIAGTLKGFNDSVVRTLGEAAAAQKLQLESLTNQIRGLTSSTENKLETIRGVVDAKLVALQESNSKKLDEMRQTVDEKLQSTLEKRLGESFKLVSDRLELVHQGLGEMQVLANGVGDLKRVLTNVKSRGGWGEVQLATILSDLLTPDQYGQNVRVKEATTESVEFAIRLPGQAEDGGEPVWLPIDAKFPLEDYERVREAQEKADVEVLDLAIRRLDQTFRNCARDVSGKYLNPPRTTDFAIMFLPTEGLFAEAARRPGLIDEIQRESRVIVAGPTTLTAIVSALQMGFRSLTIQRRSSEVWRVLGEVKSEFAKFGESVDAVRDKLVQASNRLDEVRTRSRVLGRRLKDVQELPPSDSKLVLVGDTREAGREDSVVIDEEPTDSPF